MGLDTHDAARSSLDVYIKLFEEPFLENTWTFYKVESARFLKDNPVTEYVKKAHQRLKEEEDKVELYLHVHTKGPVSLTLWAILEGG